MENRNPMKAPEPFEPILCGAKTRGGGTCKKAAMRNGTGRCRLHGGLSPSGVASPHFKHGRRSKYLKHLPGNLRNAYKAALADPELLSLKDETALLTARAMQLLDNLNATEAPPWGRAVEALNDLKVAGSADAKQQALATLEKVIRTGANAAVAQERTWRELREVVQEKTRTAAAEWKRLHDLEALVTVEDALGFAKAFLTAAKEVVTDPGILKRLQEKTMYLLPAPPGNSTREEPSCIRQTEA
jgi:hypothetical protein